MKFIVNLEGLVVTVKNPNRWLREELTCKKIVTEKSFATSWQLSKRTEPYLLYEEREDGSIEVPLGLIQWLSRQYQELEWTKDGSQPFVIEEAPRFDFSEAKSLLPYRDYQKEALDSIGTSFQDCIEAPVASGKTVCEVGVAITASKRSNALFLAPTTATRNNFFDSFSKFSVSGHRNVIDYREVRDVEGEIGIDGNVIVANPVAISNDIKSGKNYLETIETLIGDECHRFSCDTWITTFKSLKNLKKVIGFSATPYSKDLSKIKSLKVLSPEDAMTLAICGDVSFKIDVEDVKDRIDPPLIINHEFIWGKESKFLKERDWNKVSKQLLKNESRLEEVSKILKLCDHLERRCLILVSLKDLGKEILDKANLKSCVCWYGKQEIFNFHNHECDFFTLEEFYENFKSKNINHIIATNHLSEGFDLPDLDTIILVEGKKSRAQIQKAGRVARLGSNKSLVINIFDTNFEVLKDQSASRYKTLKNYYKSKCFVSKDIVTTFGLLKGL
jgi:superfamily II DNA or RNA helicase